MKDLPQMQKKKVVIKESKSKIDIYESTEKAFTHLPVWINNVSGFSP